MLHVVVGFFPSNQEAGDDETLRARLSDLECLTIFFPDTGSSKFYLSLFVHLPSILHGCCRTRLIQAHSMDGDLLLEKE